MFCPFMPGSRLNINWHAFLGGPMITKKDEDGNWYQYGILHGGHKTSCQISKYPAIFNLIDNVENVRWINKHAFNESSFLEHFVRFSC